MPKLIKVTYSDYMQTTTNAFVGNNTQGGKLHPNIENP